MDTHTHIATQRLQGALMKSLNKKQANSKLIL